MLTNQNVIEYNITLFVIFPDKASQQISKVKFECNTIRVRKAYKVLHTSRQAAFIGQYALTFWALILSGSLVCQLNQSASLALFSIGWFDWYSCVFTTSFSSIFHHARPVGYILCSIAQIKTFVRKIIKKQSDVISYATLMIVTLHMATSNL